MTEATHPDPARYGDTIIFPASLDPDAVHVVRRLCEAGLESYLVGGCVRDLLLGLIPKDFDISTEARPRQIRRLFRNSRIIGRRFKLAHIHFGDKVIEVATFRRSPDGSGSGGNGGDGGHSAQDDDLLITRDNEFGDAREDALRRDFTINALLYDVRSAEVIDHVGGVHDLNARMLRTIGDPTIRFAEDPVRMLRAVKFAARLQLQFDPDVQAAMTASAELIRKSAPPRVIEEIYKLLTCGAAERALPLLQQYALLDRLLPDIADAWRDLPAELAATGRALDLIDRGRRRVSNAFLLAALLLRPWHQRVLDAPGGDPLLPAHDLLDPVAHHMSIPRRDVAIAKHLLLGVLRVERPRRGRRGRGFDNQRGGGEPVALLYLGALTGVLDPELHARSVERLVQGAPHEGAEDGGDDSTDQLAGAEDALDGASAETGEGDDSFAPDRPRRGRRRRRGGRRHRGRSLVEGQLQGSGDRPLDGDRSPEGAPDQDSGLAPEGDADEAASSRDGEAPRSGDDPEPALNADGTPRLGRRRRGRRGGRGRRRAGNEFDSAGPDNGPARGGESAGRTREARPSRTDPGSRVEWQGPIQEDADGRPLHDPHEQEGVAAERDDASAGGAPGDGPGDGPGRPEERQGRRRSRGGRRRRRGRSGGGAGGDQGEAGAPGAPDAGVAEREPGAGRSGSNGQRPQESAGRPARPPQQQGQQPGQRQGQRTEAASSGSRARRGGNEPRRGPRPRPENEKPRRDDDRPRRDDTPTRGPGQRHPEDVEDFFDW